MMMDEKLKELNDLKNDIVRALKANGINIQWARTSRDYLDEQGNHPDYRFITIYFGNHENDIQIPFYVLDLVETLAEQKDLNYCSLTQNSCKADKPLGLYLRLKERR